MKHTKSICILTLGGILLLSGCFDRLPEESQSFSTKSASGEEYSGDPDYQWGDLGPGNWDTVYSDENVKKYVSANESVNINDLDYNTYTTGTQPILVLPIVFSDKTFSAKELEEIKILTGGKAEETKYWESLGSFYQKSSYGKLNLTFTYSDPVDMGMSAKSFYSKYSKTEDATNYGLGAAMALKKGVSAYKKAHGNDSTKPFDTDNDGYIDSVIMIYAENQTPSYDSDGSVFWAYRFWDIWNESGTEAGNYVDPNVSSPVGNSYFWASLGFFYEGTGTRDSHTGIDAHTLIHEFGHMLGADDYYNTDDEPTSEPSGCKAMMAFNVLDHDIFNKLQFNWVTPHYVNGSCTISIRPSESSGDCIILTDPDGWNGTAFDEYVIIEFFTPTGLNQLDSEETYPGWDGMGSTGYDNPGIRMWHVDNRLAKCNASSGKTTAYYSDKEVRSGNLGSNTYYPVIAASNSTTTDTEVAAGKNFDALTLISSKGSKFDSQNWSEDDDLFHEGDVFSLVDSKVSGKYQRYFANKKTLNNGNSLPYEVQIGQITSEGATLRFTKQA